MLKDLLYNWNSGASMILVFALVCLTLIAVFLGSMLGGKGKNPNDE